MKWTNKAKLMKKEIKLIINKIMKKIIKALIIIKIMKIMIK